MIFRYEQNEELVGCEDAEFVDGGKGTCWCAGDADGVVVGRVALWLAFVEERRVPGEVNGWDDEMAC